MKATILLSLGIILLVQRQAYVCSDTIAALALLLIVSAAAIWSWKKMSNFKTIVRYNQMISKKINFEVVSYCISFAYLMSAIVLICMPVIEIKYYQDCLWGKGPFVFMFLAAAIGYARRGKCARNTSNDAPKLMTDNFEQTENSSRSCSKTNRKYYFHNVVLVLLFAGLMCYGVKLVEGNISKIFISS